MNLSSSRHRPTVAVVDLAIISKNFDRLKKTVKPEAFVCPMVKANAYGHGAPAIAMRLRRDGAKHLGVALIEEAIELRSNGDNGSILQFGLFDPFGAEAMIQNRVTPTLSSRDALEMWITAVEKESAAGHVTGPIGFHLELNSGMNRLGVDPAEVASIARRIVEISNSSSPLVRMDGLATHLSDGDDFGVAGGRSEEQLRRFRKAEKELRAVGLTHFDLHLANSSATRALGSLAVTDLGIRPGIALYGIEPDAKTGTELGMKPALRWLSRVVLIQDVRQGERVSYGGRWQAPRASRVGVIPCGYADGYRRALNLKGQASIIVGGQRVPVLGTICMDYFMCDLTEVQSPKVGDVATLIGETSSDAGKAVTSVTASELAELAETIPYEIFTGISDRVPRLYVDDEASVGVTSIQ